MSLFVLFVGILAATSLNIVCGCDGHEKITIYDLILTNKQNADVSEYLGDYWSWGNDPNTGFPRYVKDFGNGIVAEFNLLYSDSDDKLLLSLILPSLKINNNDQTTGEVIFRSDSIIEKINNKFYIPSKSYINGDEYDEFTSTSGKYILDIKAKFDDCNAYDGLTYLCTVISISNCLVCNNDQNNHNPCNICIPNYHSKWDDTLGESGQNICVSDNSDNSDNGDNSGNDGSSLVSNQPNTNGVNSLPEFANSRDSGNIDNSGDNSGISIDSPDEDTACIECIEVESLYAPDWKQDTSVWLGNYCYIGNAVNNYDHDNREYPVYELSGRNHKAQITISPYEIESQLEFFIKFYQTKKSKNSLGEFLYIGSGAQLIENKYVLINKNDNPLDGNINQWITNGEIGNLDIGAILTDSCNRKGFDLPAQNSYPA